MAKQERNKEKPSKVLNWLSVNEAWNTVLRQQQYLYDRSMATKHLLQHEKAESLGQFGREGSVVKEQRRLGSTASGEYRTQLRSTTTSALQLPCQDSIPMP